MLGITREIKTMRHKTNRAIVFFCLLLLLTGCKQNTSHSDLAFPGMSPDSVERCAQDSLFTNTQYCSGIENYSRIISTPLTAYPITVFYHSIPNLILLRRILIQSCIITSLLSVFATRLHLHRRYMICFLPFII